MIHPHPPRPATVRALAFTPDGRTLISLQNREVCRWDASSGELLEEWRTGECAHHLAVSPDGSRLAIADRYCTIRLLRLGTAPRTIPSGSLDVGGYRILGFSFLGGPNDLLVSSYDESAGGGMRRGASLWDLSRRERTAAVRLANFNSGALKKAAFCPDRPLVALGISRFHYAIWSPRAGDLPGPILDASAPDFPAWDTAMGRRTADFHPPTSAARSIAIAPGGRRMATADGYSISVWDLASKAVPRQMSGDAEVDALAFDPTGHLLAAACGDALCLWDLSSGGEPARERRELGLGRLHSIAFSPDGGRVAVGGNGGIALVEVRDCHPGRRAADGLARRTSLAVGGVRPADQSPDLRIEP